MKRKILLWPVGIICILPFCLMIIGSMRGVGGGFSLKQYGMALLQSPHFFREFCNCLIYTGAIMAINMPVSLLAAYGFSRFNFRGREILFWLYIVMMLMPFQATVVPQYLTLKWLGIVHSPWAVVLPNMFATFGTFLMTQYMRGFDKSLYEAAQIDGMGSFKTFAKLVLPICKPVTSSLAVLTFVNYWSLVEQPTMFLEKQLQQPLAVKLGSGGMGEIAFAGGAIFCILPLLLYLYSYENLQAGISLTANKSAGKSAARRGGAKGVLIKKMAVIFMVAMVAFTLATQKISSVMVPQVSVYTVTRRPDVLLEYRMVVPKICVTDFGGEKVVYSVMKDTEDGKTLQVISTVVTIEDADGMYCAIQGNVRSDGQIVCHSSRPIREGDTVNVVAEAFDEKADN